MSRRKAGWTNDRRMLADLAKAPEAVAGITPPYRTRPTPDVGDVSDVSRRLGASCHAQGVHFAVIARDAAQVTLCLFDGDTRNAACHDAGR